MRYIIFYLGTLLLCFVLNSCGDRPEEKAIKDFVQTIDNSKLDLSVSILENKEIGVVKAIDSIMYIDSVLRRIGEVKRVEYQLDKIKVEGEIELKLIEQRFEKSSRMKEVRKESIATREDYLNLINETLHDIDSGYYDNLNSETLYLSKKKNRYITNPQRVIGLKYQCRYKFKNPLLNNVEEETKRIFIIDTLKSKVLIGL